MGTAEGEAVGSLEGVSLGEALGLLDGGMGVIGALLGDLLGRGVPPPSTSGLTIIDILLSSLSAQS